LGDIAEFAGVNPSTAYHHLSNLMRSRKVKRIGRGQYILSVCEEKGEQIDDSDFRKYRKFFEDFSNFEKTLPLKLNHHEKNILLEVLSKENRYAPFTATDLAEKCNLSVKSTIQYARSLEKKGLIEVSKQGRMLVFVPKDVAIKGIIEFFQSSKKEEKVDKRYSKKEKVKSKDQDTRDNQPIFETFEEALQYQIFNAHRMILQFKLLRCDHKELKRTAWIFGKKSIRKHLKEAYIYKSKNVESEIINICPKKHFIFRTQFEFQDQLTEFINNLIKRLKDYGIILDISKPVKVCLEHRAIENDEFATESVRKGLLYLKCKTVVKDQKGEPLEIVTVIDKSRAIHLEFQGPEAAHYAENYSDFVEDVATGRIDKEALRDLPEQNKRITQNISEMARTTQLFSQIQETYGKNIQAHIGTIDKLGTSVEEFTEKTTDAIGNLTHVIEELKNLIKPEYEESEGIKDVSIIYSRGRAKIPTKIFLNSNLRYKKSNNATKSFVFEHEPQKDIYLLVKTGDQVRKTRELILPKRLRKVKRGAKIVWWLANETVCFKVLTRGERGD